MTDRVNPSAHRVAGQTVVTLLVLMAFTLAMAGGAAAQDDPVVAPPQEEAAPTVAESGAPAPADDFEVRWTPYVWTPGIKGKSGMGGATSDIDIKFMDVLEDLEGAATSYVRIFKGPWSLTLDTSFVQISDDVDMRADTVVPVSGSIPTEQGPYPFAVDVPVNFEAEAEYELTQYFLESFVGYQIWGDRFAPRSASPTLGERFDVDLLAGVRYVEVDAELDVDTSLSVGPIYTVAGPFGPVSRSHSASFDHEESWFDPVIGAQVDFSVTEKLGLMARGDIGGFGVGSEFSWGAIGAAKYDFSELTSGYAGYRVLDIDYDETDFVFDAQMGGPILGMMFRF